MTVKIGSYETSEVINKNGLIDPYVKHLIMEAVNDNIRTTSNRIAVEPDRSLYSKCMSRILTEDKGNSKENFRRAVEQCKLEPRNVTTSSLLKKEKAAMEQLYDVISNLEEKNFQE